MKEANFWKPISTSGGLPITLRCLAIGESQQFLSFWKTTASNIISKTCDAIYNALWKTYLQPPSPADEWLVIAKNFEEQWKLPHAFSVHNGKHIWIQCPPDTRTLFHNYNGFFSLVLMVVCDANNCFTLTDIGRYGSSNDSGVLSRSEMEKRLPAGDIHLPELESLPGYPFDVLPFYLLGNEIFPLETWLKRPYSGKMLQEDQSVYNYRHSRPRRVIENTLHFCVKMENSQYPDKCISWKL